MRGLATTTRNFSTHLHVTSSPVNTQDWITKNPKCTILKNANPTPLPTSKQLYAAPNSPIWIARQIQESDHQSITLLHDWTHPK
jgi:hypothetical protein